jgi:ERCC4-type nuclease
MIQLLLDSREASLISLINSRDLDEYANQISIEVKQLDIGDIHICFDDIVYIIERKTVPDLLSSIKDGRYREQKSRLLASGNKITYVIEGDDIIASRQNRHNEILTGAYIHTIYRDGINVVFTKNTNDTCTYILTLCAKIIDNPKNFIQKNNDTDYVDCVKVKSKKIDNITPDVCYIMQLAQIPSISTVLAKNIQKHYGSMRELIKALEETEDKLELLCKIDKIGKEKAKNILQYLLFTETTESTA